MLKKKREEENSLGSNLNAATFLDKADNFRKLMRNIFRILVADVTQSLRNRKKQTYKENETTEKMRKDLKEMIPYMKQLVKDDEQADRCLNEITDWEKRL